MKKVSIILAMALAVFSACQQKNGHDVTIVVTNPTDRDIAGVIEGVPLKAVFDSLGVKEGTSIKLTDEMGKLVPTQIFNNGNEDLLLFETNTLANGESSYFVSVRKASDPVLTVPSAVFIKHYPQRKDDLCWENESSIWRAYGPELQATNERAFGYDIWCKNTKEMLCDERMLTALRGWAIRDSLHALGEHHLADSIGHAGSFHEDHGKGMDCYAVGPTLGGGTAALLNDEGGIVFPWAWKTHKILANGPLLGAVRLDYDTTVVAGDTVIEHRTIITQKGSRFNIINVEYEGATRAHDIAVGIAFHGDEDSVRLDKGNKYIAYSDPTDQPGRDPGRVLIGAYVPTLTRTALEQGHLLGIAKYKPGETFTYYMGSGWSKGDCASLSVMTSELKRLANEKTQTVRIDVK